MCKKTPRHSLNKLNELRPTKRWSKNSNKAFQYNFAPIQRSEVHTAALRNFAEGLAGHFDTRWRVQKPGIVVIESSNKKKGVDSAQTQTKAHLHDTAYAWCAAQLNPCCCSHVALRSYSCQQSLSGYNGLLRAGTEWTREVDKVVEKSISSLCFAFSSFQSHP